MSLRPAVRKAVEREYRDGQEINKQPSLRYLAVQRFAVAETAFKPNDEEAALTAAEYLAQALKWREAAIAGGFGDPLEGLVK